MRHRAPVLLTLFVLLTLAMVGCNTGTSTEDLEGTIVARVVATLEAAETTPSPTQVPLEPTATPAPPEPTATPTPPEPTATPTPPGPTVTPPPHIEAEEYAVYSAMIQQNPIGYGLGSFIVVREHTMLWDSDMVERSLDERPGLTAELVESYRSRNTETYTLGPNLDLAQDYALMPREEAEKLFGRGGKWDEFQATYPGADGVVMFSRVGFSANEDRALVVMGLRCHQECGAGGLYLLAKEEGGWKVIDTLVVWES